jgi:cephalosporin hydroxylase
MVDLDSSHITEHVAKELEAYAPLVTPGQMLVIEDSFLDEGPLPAIRAFFPGKEEWVNTSLEEYKFGRRLTYNPEGWWMKKVGVKGGVVGGRT